MEDSFKILREQGKSELLEILDSLRGKKCIVLDNFLGRLLTEIVFEDDIQIMKENNVQQYDISSKNLPEVLENDLGRELPDNICYLIRADFSMTKAVARHVRDCFRAGKIQTLKIQIDNKYKQHTHSHTHTHNTHTLFHTHLLTHTHTHTQKN